MFCVPSFVANKLRLNQFMRESAKKRLNKPHKCNLTRNFQHITTNFDSNHFITIICTKQCCVPSCMQNKPSLNHFMRQSAKKSLIKPSKRNLAHNLQYIIIFYDSNKSYTIIYNKQCLLPTFMQKKPSLNHIMRESAKKRLKNLKHTTQHVISSI